jgi:hypothetical protein
MRDHAYSVHMRTMQVLKLLLEALINNDTPEVFSPLRRGPACPGSLWRGTDTLSPTP